MPRVIGIDPGTISIDLCGLDDGRVFLDRSVPTREALEDPAAFVAVLEQHQPLDLIAGPSGYGLPLIAAREATDDDLRLACLAPAGESGGIGGLRRMMRTLSASGLPVVFTPGVIHLPTVPAHRKINRIDMGTADKVCAAALALQQECSRTGGEPSACSCILLELGGAFTAAVAIEHGTIVDGAGGSSGAMGLRAAGALDGEVAYLAGQISKETLFRGGVVSIAGEAAVEGTLSDSGRGRDAWDAYCESAAKVVASLMIAAPSARRVLVSGRVAQRADIRDRLAQLLAGAHPTPEPASRRLPASAARDLRGYGGPRRSAQLTLRECGPSAVDISLLGGLGTNAKHAAQGAALLADGLAGGSSSTLVTTMRIRDASGTVLDHLYVITPEEARRKLGLGH